MTREWNPSLWRDIFEELLNDDSVLDYEDPWTLNFNYSQTNEITHEERRRGWKVHSHCTFGNFECPSCSNTWSSAKVLVLFRYRLNRDRGTVIMRPLRQACRQCHNQQLIMPGFSNKDVEESLCRLFYKIRKNCYREEDDGDSCDSGRPKVLTKPHQKSLCEACRMGICCEDDDDDDDDD